MACSRYKLHCESTSCEGQFQAAIILKTDRECEQRLTSFFESVGQEHDGLVFGEDRPSCRNLQAYLDHPLIGLLTSGQVSAFPRLGTPCREGCLGKPADAQARKVRPTFSR